MNAGRAPNTVLASRPHSCSVKAVWSPAKAGMTVGGVPAFAVRTTIPGSEGMTVGGIPGCAVRTVIPAFAEMTGETLAMSFPRRRESIEFVWNRGA